MTLAPLEFFHVDVFADEPYRGNPLAVFPSADRLSARQMQRIAAEMNLAETCFVTAVAPASYRVRIFTVEQEMPFAGHPTIGTAWVLRHLGLVRADLVTQVSGDGVATAVSCEGERVWFERQGHSGADDESGSLTVAILDGLGLGIADLGCTAAPLGRAAPLKIAFADAGLRQLLVPVRDLEALSRARIRGAALTPISPYGVLCFTPVGVSSVRARCFFPEVSVWEDPATGAAAASLGLYLADRIGALDFEIVQGVEMKRASRIAVRACAGSVRVGGRCELIFGSRLSPPGAA